MYLIIGVYGTRQRKIYAAYQFFLMTLWGSLLMLMGIIVLYSQTGVTDYQILSISDISKEREYIVWLGLFISFAVKTPLVPVHLWLPEAHSEANIAGSIILAGKKYACYKFNYMLETPKALSTYLYLKLISENLNGCNNGQSAGNYPLIRSQIMNIVNIIGLNIDTYQFQLSNIKLSRILRGYTLKFRYNLIEHNAKRLNSTGGFIYPSSNGLSSYLAGLIEGDGCIYIAKNNKNASQIQISFNSKDLPLALIIQKNLNCGYVYKMKGANAYTFCVSKREDLARLTNIINGYMRTPKINQLYQLIDWLNNFEFNIEKKPLDSSPLNSNAWLSGLIDSDGHFSVRCSILEGKLIKSSCSFELVQQQKRKDEGSLYDIMLKLSQFLLTSVKNILENSKNPQYRVRTNSLNSNLILKEYLSNYPLFSSKYLDYLDWCKVLELFYIQKKKSINDIKHIQNIKSNMNNKRTYFIWNHLNFFYTVD